MSSTLEVDGWSTSRCNKRIASKTRSENLVEFSTPHLHCRDVCGERNFYLKLEIYYFQQRYFFIILNNLITIFYNFTEYNKLISN